MTLTKRNGSSLPMLFDDFFNRDLFNWGQSNYSDTNTTIPATNIRETNDSYEVEVAAPGMAKKDFKIQLDGNTLTISSEKTSENTQSKEEGRYYLKEFSYQSFYRNFQLQKDVVDVDNIKAGYEDGVLKLHIPKQEHAKQKQPKLIEVS